MKLKPIKLLTLDNIFRALIVIGVMYFIRIIFSIPIFEPLRLSIEDTEVTDYAFRKIIDRESISADTNITLINIENITNRKLAFLLDFIEKFNPKAIGLHKIILSDTNDPVANYKLKRVLEYNKNIIITKIFRNYDQKTKQFNSIISSDSSIVGNTASAHGNLFLGEDKHFVTLRNCLPIVKSKIGRDTSFAIKLAMYLNSSNAQALLSRDNEKETINWLGSNKFFSVEYQDIFLGNFDSSIINHKIILLGTTKRFVYDNPGVEYVADDLFFTPLNKNYAKSWPDMYGLQVQANIIAMVIEGNYFTKIPYIFNLLLPFIIAYLNMMLFTFICDNMRDWYELLSLCIFVIESIVLLFIMYYGFLIYLIEIEVTAAIFASALSMSIFESYSLSLKPMIVHSFNKIKKMNN